MQQVAQLWRRLMPVTPRDSQTLAVGMMVGAWLLGFAVEVTHGTYSIPALQLLALAIGAFVLAIAAPSTEFIESLPANVTISALGLCVLTQVVAILLHNQRYVVVNWGTAAIGALALTQVLNVPKLRVPSIAATLIVFSVVASMAFLRNWKDPKIDVFLYQQMGAEGLLHGRNPFSLRFPNLYGQMSRMYYGPGVVDANDQLTFGFPYPPLSLLMVLPAYVIGGDSRFADVIAVAATAGLMAAAWPSRRNGLIAALFLLTPRVFFVVERSWTEPLLALGFSVVMFCARRWRAALPYAFGLFLATKQYTVLAIPLAWLLLEQPRSFKQFAGFLAKSGLVALVITAPFFLWNPVEFYRAVVLWQLLQPMRQDALSFLVWFHENHPRIPIAPSLTPFIAVVPAIAFVLRRCPRTPAGFAAAFTLVYVVFFAVNKQAFCNYYYLVIATACWAAAAIPPPAASSSGSRANAIFIAL
jgi:hypothetical protein